MKVIHLSSYETSVFFKQYFQSRTPDKHYNTEFKQWRLRQTANGKEYLWFFILFL